MDLEKKGSTTQSSFTIHTLQSTITSRNYITLAKTSHLQSQAPAILRVPRLPSPKTVRELEAHHRPQPFKSIYRSTTVPYDDTLYSGPSDCTTSLGLHTRLTRCLSAHPHQEIAPQIYGFLLQSGTLLFQGSPIRPECGSIHIFTINALASVTTPLAKHPNASLSRRLDHLGFNPRKNPGSSAIYNWLPKKTRSSDKLPQITDHPNTTLQVVRNTVGYTGRQVEHPIGETGKDFNYCSPISKIKFIHQKGMGEVHWPDKFRGTNPKTSPAIFTTATEATASGSSHEERYHLLSPTKSPIVPKQMDKSATVTRVSPFPSQSKTFVSMDRCITGRVGGPHSIPPDCRKMGLTRVKSPHKSARDSGRDIYNKSLEPERCSVTSFHRQSGSPMHNQQVQMQVRITSPRDTSSGPDMSATQPIYLSNSHIITTERESRRPQQVATTPRLDTSTTSVQSNRDMERATANRPNGYQGKHKEPAIHSSFPRQICDSSQRSGSGVEHMEPNLPVSTQMVDTTGPAEARALSAPRSNYSSMVSGRTMVHNNPGQSIQVPTPESHRSKEEWTDSLRKMDRLQFLKTALEEQHPKEVVSQLTQAYRKSTDRQAQSVWKSFQTWLPTDIKIIDQNTVLKYLIHLQQSKNLSPRTILNYRSCLARPLRVALNLDLNSEAFELLARSQFLQNPPQQRIIPSWSIDTALDTYSKPPFLNNNIGMEELLLKTLFLTALASGNRASELAATIRAGVVFSQEKITLPVHQAFLFKNQTANNPLPPPISFPTLGRNNELCPGASLKLFIERTKNEDHKGYIFINPTSFKPLQAGRLSYWLAKSIQKGDTSAVKPAGHDIRKIGHSIAYLRGESPATILQNGFWHSPNVFIHKYLISNTTRSNKQFVAGRLI